MPVDKFGRGQQTESSMINKTSFSVVSLTEMNDTFLRRDGTNSVIGTINMTGNCVTSVQVDWPVEPQSGFSNLQEIKKYLQQRSLAIKQQQRKILGFYIDYGQWLIKARAWYELESEGGTWEQWLQKNVDITLAHCSKTVSYTHLTLPTILRV